MKIGDLPWMHFMTEEISEEGVRLVSPCETDHHGGSYYVPLQYNHQLFPAYNFDFKVHNFEGKVGQKCFTGLAVRQGADLLMVFELPHFITDRDNFMLPILRRPHGAKPIIYDGDLMHRDFDKQLVQMDPIVPTIFDKILEDYYIIVVGCNPETRCSNYEDVARILW